MLILHALRLPPTMGPKIYQNRPGRIRLMTRPLLRVLPIPVLRPLPASPLHFETMAIWGRCPPHKPVDGPAVPPVTGPSPAPGPILVKGRLLLPATVAPTGAFAPSAPSLPDDRLFSPPTVHFDNSSIPYVPGLSPPPVAHPIPGYTTGLSQPLGNDSLTSSLVYNIDRMPNPEVVVKNGTIVGIRRIGEIHVYVARYFDNHMVALGPGFAGRPLAKHLKSPNERLRPLFEAYKIPTGLSNRLCIGAASLTWGGRDREDDRVLSESAFVTWTPRDFDKFAAPRRGPSSRNTRPRNTSKRGAQAP